MKSGVQSVPPFRDLVKTLIGWQRHHLDLAWMQMQELNRNGRGPDWRSLPSVPYHKELRCESMTAIKDGFHVPEMVMEAVSWIGCELLAV
jgi:hypothetical protein